MARPSVYTASASVAFIMMSNLSFCDSITDGLLRIEMMGHMFDSHHHYHNMEEQHLRHLLVSFFITFGLKGFTVLPCPAQFDTVIWYNKDEKCL